MADMSLSAMLRYNEAGCELFEPFHMFAAIYQFTRGDPCSGCNYDIGGRCKARKALFASPPKPIPAEPMETVRAEAVRLGISISEVRRRRRAGGNG